MKCSLANDIREKESEMNEIKDKMNDQKMKYDEEIKIMNEEFDRKIHNVEKQVSKTQQLTQMSSNQDIFRKVGSLRSPHIDNRAMEIFKETLASQPDVHRC